MPQLDFGAPLETITVPPLPVRFLKRRSESVECMIDSSYLSDGEKGFTKWRWTFWGESEVPFLPDIRNS